MAGSPARVDRPAHRRTARWGAHFCSCLRRRTRRPRETLGARFIGNSGAPSHPRLVDRITLGGDSCTRGSQRDDGAVVWPIRRARPGSIATLTVVLAEERLSERRFGARLQLRVRVQQSRVNPMAVHRFIWALLLTCALGQTISSQGAASFFRWIYASTLRVPDIPEGPSQRLGPENSSRLVALLGPSVRDELRRCAKGIVCVPVYSWWILRIGLDLRQRCARRYDELWRKPLLRLMSSAPIRGSFRRLFCAGRGPVGYHRGRRQPPPEAGAGGEGCWKALASNRQDAGTCTVWLGPDSKP